MYSATHQGYGPVGANDRSDLNDHHDNNQGDPLSISYTAQENPISRSLSLSSSSPQAHMYPPGRASPSPPQPAPGNPRHVHMKDETIEMKQQPSLDEAERAGRPVMNTHSSTSSWDLLSGVRKFEHGYTEFDSRNASESHLAFADGDVPKNKLAKLYHYLLNFSIVTRWIIFIIPVLAILWIPGILSLTKFPNAKIWGVKLIWWSIWLSVVWGGWWGALAVARIFPAIIRATLGVVAIGTRRYIDWALVLHRYVALFAWTLAVWVSWNPLIDNQQHDATSKAINTVDFIGKLLFAFFLCAAVLLFEKFAIQWIAGKFHERSYAERIAEQKFAVRTLVILYRNSVDIPGRSDTLRAGGPEKGTSLNPRKFFKRAMKGVRQAATTTTTAFGNVASEITGSSVLQPNSPAAMVKTALESANKSRLLARRLYYSFTKPGAEFMLIDDIARFFHSHEEAEQAFNLFDKDSNGDASRDEVEMACMDFHREQLSIEHSMQDLDSAVGRLDNIFMSLYVVIAVLIIAVALEAQVATLVTSAGTLVLGLSWLIGGSLAEVLTSIIFLFVKHPFDVGDRVNVAKESYTVKEIRLLSTIFLDSNGVYVQAPNTKLNSEFIQNIRRSPQMSEAFPFDVSYGTTFEDLEALREKMLKFLVENKRDYQTVFDVAVKDFPEQEKMTLSADIKYKSNAQQGALKAKRRNKWICALKAALAELKIFGPGGDPGAKPPPTKYTKVPYEEVVDEERKERRHEVTSLPPTNGWRLSDRNAALLDPSDNIFGESDELNMTSPRRGYTDAQDRAQAEIRMPTAMPMPAGSSTDNHGPDRRF